MPRYLICLALTASLVASAATPNTAKIASVNVNASGEVRINLEGNPTMCAIPSCRFSKGRDPELRFFSKAFPPLG